MSETTLGYAYRFRFNFTRPSHGQEAVEISASTRTFFTPVLIRPERRCTTGFNPCFLSRYCGKTSTLLNPAIQPAKLIRVHSSARTKT